VAFLFAKEKAMTTEKSTQHTALSIQSLNRNLETREDASNSTAENPRTANTTVSGQEILAVIREMAERLGRYPSMPELRQAHPEIKMGTVQRNGEGSGKWELHRGGAETRRKANVLPLIYADGRGSGRSSWQIAISKWPNPKAYR
jgi:hypothetical protein